VGLSWVAKRSVLTCYFDMLFCSLSECDLPVTRNWASCPRFAIGLVRYNAEPQRALTRSRASGPTTANVWRARSPASPPNLLRRGGASPPVAWGTRDALGSAPNLLRRSGASPPRRETRGVAWVAHQTYCDVVGRAHPSRGARGTHWVAHQTCCDAVGLAHRVARRAGSRG
jgi:hypothetical protein